MAVRTELKFKSSDGIHDIRALRWEPDSGKYFAVLQLIHGMNEHIERYDEFANFMCKNGFLVVGHDHLGHGSSISDMSELGYFSEHPGDDLVKDINRLRVITETENLGLPYFMLGHSMGSYLLRSYLAIYGRGLSGAVIMGTGYNDPIKVRGGLALVKTLSLTKGPKYRNIKVQAMVNGSSSYKGFDLNGRVPENSWLSKNVESVKKYYEDPKCRFKFTMNGYQGLLEAVLFSCSKKNVESVPTNIPIYIVSGAQDPVGDLGEGAKKVFSLFVNSRIDIPNAAEVDFKLFEGDRHEILNETDRAEVYEDLLRWIKRFC